MFKKGGARPFSVFINEQTRPELATHTKKMPRCCDPAPEEFAPCYASVLVAGGSGCQLRDAVEDMENASAISPCATAWCPTCRRISTITSTRGRFPTASAHLAHVLVARSAMERTMALANPLSNLPKANPAETGAI
jgi:hypothetical protein